MAKKKTHEEYENELFLKEVDIWPLESYKGANIAILHECICGNIYKSNPSGVLRAKHCVKCANTAKRKTVEAYKTQIPSDIEFIHDKYINTDTIMLHKHIICGTEWMVKPNDILSGKGCPSCSKKGFKYSKEAFVYHISFTEDNKTIYYKVGITNNSNLRTRFNCDWDNYNIELIWMKKVSDGFRAKAIESHLLTKYKYNLINTGLLKNGNTETLNCKVPYWETDFIEIKLKNWARAQVTLER